MLEVVIFRLLCVCVWGGGLIKSQKVTQDTRQIARLEKIGFNLQTSDKLKDT